MFYLVSPKELALDENDKMPDFLIKDGIPMFILFIGLEFIFHRIIVEKRKKNFIKKRKINNSSENRDWFDIDFGKLGDKIYYRFKELFTSIGIGATEQIVNFSFDVLGLISTIMVYSFFYNNYRINTIDIKSYPITSYISLFIIKDFIYYWTHRCLHEYHILWAAHMVHHSGEDYNLGTGLRQGALQNVMSIPFVIPVAILGFPPQAYSGHSQLNTMYQFSVHTDTIERLWFGLEYVLNSPADHRMHHRPPGNCNYGGVLIIWDRLFGTFIPEINRKDYYGLAKQPNTFDPIKLNFIHYGVIQRIRNKSLINKILTRRVKWKWICSFKNLFEPIPKVKEDLRPLGPVRSKWNGHLPTTGINYLFKTIINIVLLSSIIGTLILGNHLSKENIVILVLSEILAVSFMAKSWDNYPKLGNVYTYLTFLLTNIIVFVLFSQPLIKI
jgi:sterol desaturase/sphingolipid hydroxylase (fatty acid hydroxylase superfamily)